MWIVTTVIYIAFISAMIYVADKDDWFINFLYIYNVMLFGLLGLVTSFYIGAIFSTGVYHDFQKLTALILCLSALPNLALAIFVFIKFG